jgi:hypothetical protein
MRWLICLLPAVLAPLAAWGEDPKPHDYPRRALVVQVHDYLYLNPLTAATPARNRDALDRLAASLRILNGKTNHQFFVLSDNLSADERIPTRPAILAAVRQFCQTSRSQDRIVLYFRGHAFESRDQAYFAPVEGEAGDLKTLIPISAIYAELKSCKAAQKVVVWDVCPRNPESTTIRPTAGPMTLELLLALASPGGGMEVFVPCLPSQYSLEFATPRGDGGSVLLEAMRKGLDDAGRDKADPAEPLPFAEAMPAIEKYLETAVKPFGARQNPKLLGKRNSPLAAIDSAEPPPAAVTFPKPGPVPAEAKAILQELALPPLVLGVGADPLPTLPFTAAALAAYRADVSTDDILRNGDKYPLRVAALRAIQTIRDAMHPVAVKDAKPVTQLSSPIRETQKKFVQEAQAPLAVSVAKLELEMGALETLEPLRARETKRWQANYDYALAQIRLRVALLNEYNLALAHVRTDSLPELPTGFTAWRLTPTDKMLSKKNVKDLASAARSTLEALASEHKGTPWEMLAKRALATPPGLRWEPVLR